MLDTDVARETLKTVDVHEEAMQKQACGSGRKKQLYSFWILWYTDMFLRVRFMQPQSKNIYEYNIYFIYTLFSLYNRKALPSSYEYII